MRQKLRINTIGLWMVLLVGPSGLAFGQECKAAPADPNIRFALAGDGQLQMPLGSSRQFQVETFTPPARYTPLEDICAEWRIEPVVKGITLNKDGLLSISKEAAADTTIEIIAALGHDREATVSVHIYDKAQHPLAGYWRQEGGQQCPGGPDPTMRWQPAIGELALRTDAKFSVTWTPFETYVDYSGKYRIQDGRIFFTVTWGNWIPKYFQGDFRFHQIDPKRLELSGGFFGNRDNDNEGFSTRAQQCRYVFVKTADPM